MARPARRWLRWTLAGMAALIVILALGFTWLVTTAAGLRRAVTLVESVGAVRIRVDGAEGRLIGPLAVEAVEIEHPRASIRIAGLAADYEPLEILAGRISAEGVKVREATVILRRAAGPATRPPSFMPGWLTVAVDDASVGRFLLVSPSGTESEFRDVRGSARISRSLVEFRDARARASGWAVAGASGRLFAREPLALDVTTAWSLTEGNAVNGLARATGDLDRLRVDADVAAPARGRVQAELRDLSTQPSFRGEARIDELDLAQWLANPPVGPLAATLGFEGDRSRYAARGIVRGRGLPEPGVRVDARARYADRIVTIDSLALEAAPGLDLRAAGTLQTGDDPAFDVSATWDAFRWPLAGKALVTSTRGTLSAEGWTAFRYRIGGNFAPAQGPPLAGEASGRLTETALVVDASSWRVMGGRVSLTGSLGRDDAKEWSVSGRAAGIDPSKFRENVPGRLGFEFSGNGRGFEPDGPWIARFRRLNGELRGQPLRGHGIVRRRPGRLEFDNLAMSLGTARLEADGGVGRGADLEGRLAADDLSAILPELGGRVDATVRMRGRIMLASFNGRDLAYGSHSAVVLSVDARVDRQNLKHSWLRL